MSDVVNCGRCGVGLALSQADISADGYRCSRCSAADQVAQSYADRAAESRRASAVVKLRLALTGGLFFGALTIALSGTGRWIGVAGLALFLLIGAATIRGLWRIRG
jgi:hypothetical protein